MLPGLAAQPHIRSCSPSLKGPWSLGSSLYLEHPPSSPPLAFPVSTAPVPPRPAPPLAHAREHLFA